MPNCVLDRGVYLVRFTQEEIGVGACEDIEHCLEGVLARLPEGTAWILVDMQGVRFLRSSGLGAMLSLCETLKARKIRVAVCHVPPFGRNLFKISRLEELLKVYPGIDEAMAELAAPPA